MRKQIDTARKQTRPPGLTASADPGSENTRKKANNRANGDHCDLGQSLKVGRSAVSHRSNPELLAEYLE